VQTFTLSPTNELRYVTRQITRTILTTDLSVVRTELSIVHVLQQKFKTFNTGIAAIDDRGHVWRDVPVVDEDVKLVSNELEKG